MSWDDLISVEVDFDNDGTFEDVSDHLLNVEITRGATRTESPVLRYEPGNAQFSFRNDDRHFDPTNLQGPYVEMGSGGGSDNPEHVFVCSKRQFFGIGWTVNVASASGQQAQIRAVSAKATGATSSTTVPKPTGTVSGDKLIAFHFADVGPLSALGTPTGGASWGTVKASRTEGDEALQGKIWEKTAGGSEPASYGFTQSASSDGVIIIVAITAGTWTGNATYATPVSNPETRYFTTPANTPIGANDLVLRAVQGTAGGSGSTWSEPSPQEYEEQADLQSFDYTTAALYARSLESVDAVGVDTLIKPQRPIRATMPWTFTPTTNYVRNPSAEIDTQYVSAFTNGSVSRVDDVARFGGYSIEVVRVATNPSFYIYGASFQTDSGIVNGNQVTISAYVYIPADAWDPGLGFMLNANTLSGSFVTGPSAPDTWHRLTLTGTVTGAVTEVQVQVWTDDVHHDGQVIAYIDGVQIEKAATASDFCDGTQPGCTWTGTEHASSSTRASSVTFGLFRGFVDQWNVSWQDPNWSVTSAPATDGFKVLSRNERVAVAAVGAGETTGARIGRILDSAGWPAGLRDIATGDSTVQATTLEGSALTEMEKIADTEIGELYINGDGVVVFRNRQALITESRSAMVQAILSDDDTDPQAILYKYDGLGISYDMEQFANYVIATREGGSPQVATDPDAIIEANGTISYEASGLMMESDDEAQAYADWLLYISKDPELRFNEVTVQVHADPDRLIPMVLAREIGDRVRVIRHPPGGGDPIIREVFIRGIKHVISRDLTWETTWALQSATKVGSFLTFDHPTLSILGDNALGY